MKEITTELTLKVTIIEKVEDNDVADYILSNKDKEIQKRYAKAVASFLNADKVDIGTLKHFVMDIPDERTEVFFDDTEVEND